MITASRYFRTFCGLTGAAAGIVSANLDTPKKEARFTASQPEKGKALRNLLSPDDDKDKPEEDPEKPDPRKTLLGDSKRAQSIVEKVLKNLPDYKKTAIFMMDLDDMEFEDNDESIEILKNTIVINKPSSLKDFLYQLLERGHENNPYMTPAHGQSEQPQSGPSSADSTPGSSPEPKMTYSMILRKASPQKSPEAPQISRPERQQKALSRLNCGRNCEAFRNFFRKHIIPKAFDPATSGLDAFEKVVSERIGDPSSNFTIFFQENSEDVEYLYDDRNDLCKATEFFPAFTCQRHEKDDHLSICYLIGTCRPSYVQTNGHLKAPLECQTMDLPEGSPNPDFRVHFDKMMEIQQRFASQMVKIPPLEIDWRLAEYRARKWEFKRRNPGQIFTEPRPEGPLSPRESKYSDYKRALDQHLIDNIPQEVVELFYRLPRYFFSGAREEPENRHGVLAVGRLIKTVNPFFVPPPDPSKIPDAPNLENYPPLGASSSPERRFAYKEGDRNQDTSDENNLDLTASIGNMIIDHQKRRSNIDK